MTNEEIKELIKLLEALKWKQGRFEETVDRNSGQTILCKIENYLEAENVARLKEAAHRLLSAEIGELEKKIRNLKN